jgi:hypothetical protein
MVVSISFDLAAQLEHRCANCAGTYGSDSPGGALFRPDEIGTIMRTLTLLPVAIALLQVTAFAVAQSGQTEATLLSEIQVRPVAGQTYGPTPMQVAEMKGDYAMDNGETLKISIEHRRLVARVGQGIAAELVPVAENRFASADRRMTMEFKPIAFGDQILLTYPASPDVASSKMITVRLAAK